MQSIDTLITYYDFLIAPLYILIILFVASIIKSRNFSNYKEYKYFISGLLIKILGVICFGLIYVFYYGGGDTVNYFLGARSLGRLLIYDFDIGKHILFNTNSPYNSLDSFNSYTGWPLYYMWRDNNTFFVSRFTSIFYLLSSDSFLITSFFTAIFSYIGTWKLFRLFNTIYPNNHKVFAYLILFLPSLVFWGSGIMKDSYVIGSTCWITYNFYQVFINRKKIILNLIFLFINLFIIINTKSYVIISLIPGMLIWLNSVYVSNISNRFLKILFIPILLVIISSIGFFAFNNLSSLMGVYGNVDTAIAQAQLIQEDLLREDQYGANNYDLGKIDGSTNGILSIAPLAVFTAIYRPLFWEIGSPVMVLSVIENTCLLFFTIYILLVTGPIRLFRVLISQPILFYCFIFSIFFAFGVGVAGTNFGALVRYRVPLVPFYFPMLFIVYKLSKAKKKLA
jgi:hypothetical protein